MHVKFSWFDYFLLVLMLTMNILIGVYYGFIKKQRTAADYLLGNKQMGILPVSISLTSSTLSGLTLLAIPADIYRFGMAFGLSIVTIPFVIFAGYLIYIPVFYKLKITSIYEYLNLRFDSKVRNFASILFTIEILLSLPIVIYLTALTLGQSTGINPHFVTPIVWAVCIFYSSLGGLKAIVWTDTVQFVVMLGCLFVTLALGVVSVGGFGVIFAKARSGGRLDISFDANLVKRDTFWTGTLGMFITFMYHFDTNAGFVQKCMSLPSFRAVGIALSITTIGLVIIFSSGILAGLVMFAAYFECDPLERGLVSSHDQLVPMFVLEVASGVPGLPGLFISGIIAGSLSMLATVMNSLAATIYENFISRFIPENTSQERIGWYLKLLVVFIGVLSTACVYIVEKLGSLLTLAISFAGVSTGPLLGLFTAGILLPTVNEKGALYGAITSFITMLWIVMRAQWYVLTKAITYSILPVSANGCNETISNNTNQLITRVVKALDDNTTNSTPIVTPHAIYRVSMYWYALMGLVISLVVSSIVSFFTEARKPVKRECVSPLVHFLLRNQQEGAPKYDTVDNALVRLKGVELSDFKTM